MQNQQPMNIRINPGDVKGVYSNGLMVRFNKDEFIVDFLNILPPETNLVSRVCVMPEHVKRMVGMLVNMVGQNEKRFGKLEAAEKPKQDQSMGFHTD